MPWNENDAWTITVKKPRKRSRVMLLGSKPAPAKTPGFFQYCVGDENGTSLRVYVNTNLETQSVVVWCTAKINDQTNEN